MRRFKDVTGHLSLLALACASLAACQRAPDPAATPTPAGPAAPTPSATSQATADAAAETVSSVASASGDVLQAYVWNCDGDLTLRMKNLMREGAITLEMHEGGRKLPQVVSASGAKYSDGSLTFWTKGETATLERAGSAPIQCRQNRFESLLADARARGVLYRGSGNEPGWTVEVGPGTRLVFVTDYGTRRYEFETSEIAKDAAAGTQVYEADRDAERLQVTIARQPCTDDMSGQSFDHRVTVDRDDKSYRGCATALQ